MSDSEATAAETQDAPPTQTADGSPPPPAPDVATDVAPTRRARRRPEAEAEETREVEKEEEEPPKTSSESTVSQGGWGGYWGSWGKSILSTATSTVATVGQGLTQVIEKAETSLGIPSPSEVSAQVEEEEKQQTSSPEGGASGETDHAVGGAMAMFTSLSSVVQSTGKTVISGGLDALEFIGKKTMDVIAEGDPGFKKTKGLMIHHSTLSQVLREAKEREELQAVERESSDAERKVVAHYGMLFDEFQGLSHLEALEILSRDSESKVKSVLTTLSGGELLRLREELARIRASFSLVELDDEDADEQKDEDGSEFEGELTKALEGLSVSATSDKLSKVCQSACSQIRDLSRRGEEDGEEEEEEVVRKTASVAEVHAAAIRSLAELTARSIELFHKLAEMVLFSSGSPGDGVLSQLTVVLCKQISLLSRKFTSCLTAAGSNERGDVLNPLITGVFLEASNSASYIQDAFQLLMPILEVSHIQRTADSTEQ